LREQAEREERRGRGPRARAASADLEHLPPADLLVIDTYRRGEAGGADAGAVPPAAVPVPQLPLDQRIYEFCRTRTSGSPG
jgi:hypothetical protein